MKERFTRLYEYNIWANNLFSDVLKSQPFENQQIEKLFSHISNAQFVWLDRIKPLEREVPGIWELQPLHEAIELIKEGSSLWLDFIYSQEEYESVVSYKNSKGDKFETRLSDILTHVANHGTHHRGQIATLLRQEDIDPPSSDFIFYVRS